jgi:hypothetical protein
MAFQSRRMEFETALEAHRTAVIVGPMLNPIAALRNRNSIASCSDLPIRRLLQFVGAQCSSNESKETANGDDRIRTRILVAVRDGRLGTSHIVRTNVLFRSMCEMLSDEPQRTVFQFEYQLFGYAMPGSQTSTSVSLFTSFLLDSGLPLSIGRRISVLFYLCDRVFSATQRNIPAINLIGIESDDESSLSRA